MKKATAAKVTSETTDIVRSQSPSTTAAPLVRILKVKTCPNLKLRVYSNTGNGYFSRGRVTLDAVFKALDKCPTGKPLTAFWLHPIFAGKSINTPSFLMAVLLAEGLVKKVDRAVCGRGEQADRSRGGPLQGDVETKATPSINRRAKQRAATAKP